MSGMEVLDAASLCPPANDGITIQFWVKAADRSTKKDHDHVVHGVRVLMSSPQLLNIVHE